MGREALGREIGKLLNGPGEPPRTEPAVIGECFRCSRILVLGKEHTAPAPRAVSNRALLLEAPREPRLRSSAGVCALSEKQLPFQLPVPPGQHTHPTASQLRGPPASGEACLLLCAKGTAVPVANVPRLPRARSCPGGVLGGPSPAQDKLRQVELLVQGHTGRPLETWALPPSASLTPVCGVCWKPKLTLSLHAT